MWIAYTHTTASLPAVGGRFGRDHSTVFCAVATTEKLWGDYSGDIKAVVSELVADGWQLQTKSPPSRDMRAD